MTAAIIPGAEAESIDGGPAGALVLHGFTGNPNSMRGIAHALAGAGMAVELPLLPGHGTAVEDLVPLGWKDWLGAAEEALAKLQARIPGKVMIVGLSMGGALTCWLASDHPEIAGIAAINAVVSEPAGMRDFVQQLVEDGQELMEGIGSDIADPDATESSYSQTPLRPLLTMMDAASEFQARLERIACPVLVINSAQDHVVAPENSDLLARSVKGPVERHTYERSYHVITLDHDKDDVVAKVVDFARRVTAQPRT